MRKHEEYLVANGSVDTVSESKKYIACDYGGLEYFFWVSVVQDASDAKSEVNMKWARVKSERE